MGGLVCGLVQPPAPPQRHQVRHTPRASQRSSRGVLPSPRCRLRTGPSAQSTALVTSGPLLAPARSGLDQPTVSRNRTRTSYVDDGCLNSSRGVIFPSSYRIRIAITRPATTETDCSKPKSSTAFPTKSPGRITPRRRACLHLETRIGL